MFQEEQSIVFQKSKEPGVIDREMLIALVVEQGPKGEAGKLFVKNGIDLNNTTEIRIEFFNILHIDCLWIMPNLVKLNLSKNIIEEIENLTELVNLKELDLSFNHIKIIENLNHLKKLEILLLYSNNISVVENIDDLRELTIFNIGKNNIGDREHVIYLRKFKKLRSLNTAENPCTESEEYISYLYAFLPQLLYYQYHVIRKEDREEAIEKHQKELNHFLIKEKIDLEETDEQEALEEQVALLSKSYVEYLNNDLLFQQMFSHDTEGNGLVKVNDDTQNAYNAYRNKFMAICLELYEYGLEEQKRRENEINDFNGAVNKAKESIQNEARSVVNEALEQKTRIFAEMKECVVETSQEVGVDLFEEMTGKINVLSEEFDDMMTQTWTKLMEKEVALHDQLEDINEVFKVNLRDIVSAFLETARGYFGRLRDAETEYNDIINQLVLFYISGLEDEKNMPENLLKLCGDKNILSSNLTASHDKHLQVIDEREDSMFSRLQSWHEKYIENLLEDETERHRKQILEISHFLKYLRDEFDSHQHQLQLDDADPDISAALKEEN